jgi:LCP family protein required for cell wall assembly
MIRDNNRHYRSVRRPQGIYKARSPYENYARRRVKSGASSFRKILSLMFLIFVLALSSIFMFAGTQDSLNKLFGEKSFISKVFSKLSRGNSSKNSPEFVFPFGPRRENILLLGVDSNGPDSDLWNGTRTDTMILMNIDPRTKTINAISIPRDSKVFLPNGKGTEKINAAHAIGGIKMTIKTVEDSLGVKVDRYIMFHDAGVREVVKALGGVDIYVEKNMHYDDYAGNLHINFTKGHHHLSENDVVEYLRFRHDAMGDIGRTKRQQWFLRGLLADLKKPETIVKIPKIVSVVNKYVKTDMTPYEMTQYATLATHFDMDNIEVAMLPGGPNQHGYISYWILDPEQTQKVVDRLIYRSRPKVEKEYYTASIMSTPDKSAEAEELKLDLTNNGIKVVCSGTSSSVHSQFIAHSDYATIDYYAALKKEVPSVKSKQFVYEPANYMCAESDFTIVLGGEN